MDGYIQPMTNGFWNQTKDFVRPHYFHEYSTLAKIFSLNLSLLELFEEHAFLLHPLLFDQTGLNKIFKKRFHDGAWASYWAFLYQQ